MFSNLFSWLESKCLDDEPKRDREERGKQDVEAQPALDALCVVLASLAVVGDGFAPERS